MNMFNLIDTLLNDVSFDEIITDISNNMTNNMTNNMANNMTNNMANNMAVDTLESDEESYIEELGIDEEIPDSDDELEETMVNIMEEMNNIDNESIEMNTSEENNNVNSDESDESNETNESDEINNPFYLHRPIHPYLRNYQRTQLYPSYHSSNNSTINNAGFSRGRTNMLPNSSRFIQNLQNELSNTDISFTNNPFINNPFIINRQNNENIFFDSPSFEMPLNDISYNQRSNLRDLDQLLDRFMVSNFLINNQDNSSLFSRNRGLFSFNNSDNILNSSLYDEKKYKNVISEKAKNLLKKVKYEKNICSNETCPITQDIFQEGDSVTVLPCGHGFSQGTVERWLEKQSNECPICRYEFESIEMKNESDEENNIPLQQSRNQFLSSLNNTESLFNSSVLFQPYFNEEEQLNQAIMNSLKDVSESNENEQSNENEVSNENEEKK